MDFVGLSEEDSERLEEFVREKSPCFGEDFAKTSDACKTCRAPVEINGEIHLLRDVCKRRSRGGEEDQPLHRLSSQDVLSRLQSGADPFDIWREILNGQDPDAMGVEARKVLANRFRYLEQEKGLPVPDIPRSKKMIERV